jgi:hypothetical protein
MSTLQRIYIIAPMDQQPDIRETHISETSLNQSVEALAKQLEPYREVIAAFLSTIAQVAEQWQKGIAKIAEIDWAGGLERLEASQSALAEAGWTPVDWIGLQELGTLSQKKPKELDEYFTNGFMTDNARNLDALRGKLLNCSGLAQWHELLEEIFVSIKAGRHRIAIPATLTIIEGRLANFLLARSAMGPRNSNPFKALEKKGWHRSGYDAFFWKSAVIFLEKVFGDRWFDEAQPSFISRHWILHGRSAIDWTLADSLRLTNALATLDFLFETVGAPS